MPDTLQKVPRAVWGVYGNYDLSVEIEQKLLKIIEFKILT